MSPSDLFRWINNPKTNHEKFLSGIQPESEVVIELLNKIKTLEEIREKDEAKHWSELKQILQIKEKEIASLNNQIETIKEDKKNVINNLNDSKKIIASLERKLAESKKTYISSNANNLSGIKLLIYYIDSVSAEALQLKKHIEDSGGKVFLKYGDGGIKGSRILYYKDGETLQLAQKTYGLMKNKRIEVREISCSPSINIGNMLIVLK